MAGLRDWEEAPAEGKNRASGSRPLPRYMLLAPLPRCTVRRGGETAPLAVWLLRGVASGVAGGAGRAAFHCNLVAGAPCAVDERQQPLYI